MATEIVDNKTLKAVIAASSVGTLIEWYDFYIFGSLAAIISTQFFPSTNPTAALLSTLATFAAGFVVRPFGALVFGRLGDLIGRKYTFLVTLLIMGGSTFAIGLIPSYKVIGFWAPFIVLILRLLQGLALGGEYGGAATYVAEHSPSDKRGFWTSWIQTTATLGLFLSLGVILITRETVGVEAFGEWGWRVPFVVSAFLIAISFYIRLKMAESPLFSKLKKEGKTSTNPLKESFGNKANMKMVLLALFGAVAGQGVVWYTGQFYALSFIQNTLSIEFKESNYIIAIALLLATPFFIIFGAWSDRIGRKRIMMVGMLLAIISYRPIYQQMYNLADLKTKTEVSDKTTITRTGKADKNGVDSVYTTVTLKTFTDGTTLKETKEEKVLADKTKTAPKATTKKAVNLPSGSYWLMIFFVFIQVVYVTMVYGPIAAFLVEMFPTKIRYTSMSLPYHIGNGIFGGLTPFIATRLVEAGKEAETAAAATAGRAVNPANYAFDGLWYPIIIAAVCLIIGTLYLSNKIDKDVMD